MSSVPGCCQASVPFWLLAEGLHLLSSKSLHRLPESLYDMAKASLRASDEREKNPRQKLTLKVTYDHLCHTPMGHTDQPWHSVGGSTQGH